MAPLRPHRLGPAALLALALAVPAAAAEKPVYKYRLPGGGVLYSDAMNRSAGTLEEVLTPPPQPTPQQVAAARRADAARDAALRERLAGARAGNVDAAADDVAAARHALADAQAALDHGLAPLPGERRGNVDGHSRLTPAYWRRVALLREDVERARERVELASARLQALR